MTYQTQVTVLPEGMDREALLARFASTAARPSMDDRRTIIHTPEAAASVRAFIAAFEQRQASEAREARAASLREAQASMRVGGLSVDDAERLVNLIRGGAEQGALPEEVVEQIPDDLRKALGIQTDLPEYEARITVRFKRDSMPSATDVTEWVRAAFYEYSVNGHPPCGTDALDTDHDPTAWLVSARSEVWPA